MADFAEVPIRHEARLAKIAGKMSETGFDFLMLTRLPSLAYAGNIYQSLAWYTNTCVLLSRDGDSCLVAPLGDVDRISTETWIKRIEPWNPQLRSLRERKFEKVIGDFVRAKNIPNPVIGVEDNLSWTQYANLKSELPNAEFRPCAPVINSVMVIKEEEELPRIRKVASLCDIGYEAAVRSIRAGMSEVQLVGEVEYAMRKAGCEGYWVPNQAGTGEIVLTDHYPGQAVIRENHIVKFGIHPQYKLYCGDIAVTTTLKKPDPKFKHMADVCTEATQACIDIIKPGVRACEIDAVFRKIMNHYGYGDEYTGWYIGHGIGTGHQPPFISGDDQTVLEKNMVIVVNTMAVKKGQPGVVYETMLLVTDNGYERLNRNPMHLVEL